MGQGVDARQAHGGVFASEFVAGGVETFGEQAGGVAVGGVFGPPALVLGGALAAVGDGQEGDSGQAGHDREGAGGDGVQSAGGEFFGQA